MPTEPLQPFSPPTELLGKFHLGSLTSFAGTATTWFLYAVFAYWAIYTLVAIYHWLRYSHASWLALPAIALHLCVSLALMSYVLSGNASFLSAYIPI